jgi:hypothetical protein
MSKLRNALGALGVLFMGATSVQAEKLSDYQGRDHIPDTPSTNCARQVLLNIKRPDETFFQDANKENGSTIYMFELYRGSSPKAHIDVISGRNDTFKFSAERGRLGEVQRELQRVCPSLTTIAP